MLDKLFLNLYSKPSINYRRPRENILSDTVYQYLPTNPEDTGRKLNVHKTLRRRPGRLLNVLCTFNLRPVSTGKAD